MVSESCMHLQYTTFLPLIVYWNLNLCGNMALIQLLVFISKLILWFATRRESASASDPSRSAEIAIWLHVY